MTNHIGKSVMENPVEWFLIIFMIIVVSTAFGVLITDKPVVCVVEAKELPDNG